MPKLLDRVRTVMKTRHYSFETEKRYIYWIKKYIFYHNVRNPNEMGAVEIQAFLSHLAVERNVSASTQNQALCALLFLYRNVLRIELPRIENGVRAKRPVHLPVVFTPLEAKAILANLKGIPFLAASLMYGAGLRLTEALHLRIKDIDFETRNITVRDGKGEKDRTTLLQTTFMKQPENSWLKNSFNRNSELQHKYFYRNASERQKYLSRRLRPADV